MELTDRIKAIKPSGTLAFAKKAKDMIAKGIDIKRFDVGDTDFDTPDHIKEAAIDSIKKGETHYSPSQGLPELRALIAEKLNKENNIDAKTEEIIITPGGKQAIAYAILATIQKGDKVLIPEPAWVSFEDIVNLAEGTPVKLPTEESNNFKLKPEQIEDYADKSTKMLILNNPCNPTGSFLDKQELEEIAEVTKKHDLLVLSDETYEKIIFDKKFCSFASIDGMRDRTITINSFSKTYAMTGWRVGYMHSKQYTSDFTKLQEASASCMPIFVQRAAIAALQGSKSVIDNMIKDYRKRRDLMINELKKIKRISCTTPEGTFYAFPNIKNISNDSLDFANTLLEKAHISAIPGIAFGKTGESHLRLCFANSEDNIKTGMNRLKQFVDDLK